jgi:hypothetical protein
MEKAALKKYVVKAYRRIKPRSTGLSFCRVPAVGKAKKM